MFLSLLNLPVSRLAWPILERQLNRVWIWHVTASVMVKVPCVNISEIVYGTLKHKSFPYCVYNVIIP